MQEDHDFQRERPGSFRRCKLLPHRVRLRSSSSRTSPEETESSSWHVTLVDEYNTSQFCCQCHHALVAPRVTHSLSKIEGSKSMLRKLERKHFKRLSDERYSEKPHGLRCCSFCPNESGSPKFHHRDLNSAQNIMDIYLSLAQTGTRPEVFSRC